MTEKETATKKKICILVTGARACNATQLRWVNWALAKIASKYDPKECSITLVHGDCDKGVDRHAGAVADHLGMRVHKMPADWKRYGKSAGYKRNAQMVEAVARCSADIKVCVGFPTKLAWKQHLEGKEPCDSKGTINTITAAQEAGLKTWVVPLSIETPPSGPKPKVRVKKQRDGGDAEQDSVVRDKWATEASETRYASRDASPELVATRYTVPGSGYEWVLDIRRTIEKVTSTGETVEMRNPGYKKYMEFYEGQLTRHSLPLSEVKKWLDPNMWE